MDEDQARTLLDSIGYHTYADNHLAAVIAAIDAAEKRGRKKGLEEAEEIASNASGAYAGRDIEIVRKIRAALQDKAGE